MKVIRAVLNTVVAVVVIVLCAAFLLPKAFGYQPYMVVSASMKQSFPVGSLIFVRDATPEEIEVGDPITFRSGTLTITHRVIDVNREDGYFITKGDNNESSERVRFENLQGKALNFAIPYLGYFSAWFITSQGRIVTMIILMSLLLLGVVIGKMCELEDEEDEDSAVETQPASVEESQPAPTGESEGEPSGIPAGEPAGDSPEAPAEDLTENSQTMAAEESGLTPDEAAAIINEELERKEGEINEQSV